MSKLIKKILYKIKINNNKNMKMINIKDKFKTISIFNTYNFLLLKKILIKIFNKLIFIYFLDQILKIICKI